MDAPASEGYCRHGDRCFFLTRADEWAKLTAEQKQSLRCKQGLHTKAQFDAAHSRFHTDGDRPRFAGGHASVSFAPTILPKPPVSFLGNGIQLDARAAGGSAPQVVNAAEEQEYNPLRSASCIFVCLRSVCCSPKRASPPCHQRCGCGCKYNTRTLSSLPHPPPPGNGLLRQIPCKMRPSTLNSWEPNSTP